MADKKKITIFSTKAVRGKKGKMLFDKETPKVEDPEVQNLLCGYFMSKVEEERPLEQLLDKGGGSELLQSFFDEKLKEVVDTSGDNKTTALDGLKTDNDKKIFAKIAKKVDPIYLINECYKEEIKGKKVVLLVERVKLWGLTQKVLEESEEWGKIVEKSTMYRIGKSDVYALHCLEPEDMDINKDSWLPCLLKCAFALAGHPADGLKIQLVMHDAELAEIRSMRTMTRWCLRQRRKWRKNSPL